MAWGMRCDFWRHLCRLRQAADDTDVPAVNFDQRGVWSQTNAGLASVLAIGVFVLVSQSANQISGASVIISLLFACFVGTLSSICFMDLHARLAPIARSRTAYDYTYCTIGEMAAFSTGWFTLLQSTAMTAVSARAIGQNIDCFFDWTLANLTLNELARQRIFGYNIDLLATVFVATATMICVYVSARHVDALMVVSNLITIGSLLTLSVVAMFSMDFSDWFTIENLFPSGASGVLTGAGTVYFAFTCSQHILHSANLQTVRARKTYMQSSTICTCAVTILLIFTGCVMTMDASRRVQTSSEASFASILGSIACRRVRRLANVAVVLAIAPFLLQTCCKYSLTSSAMTIDGLLPPWFKFDATKSSAAILAQIGAAAVAATLLDVTNLAQLCCVATLANDVTSAVGLVMLQHHHVGRSPSRQRMSRIKNDKKAEEKTTNNARLCDSLVSVISPLYGTARAGRKGTAATASDEKADDAPSSSSSEDTDIDDIVEEYQESIRVSVVDANPTAYTHARATAAILVFCVAAAGGGVLVSRRASLLFRADATTVVCLLLAILIGVLCIAVIGRLPCRPSPLAGAIVRLEHARCVSVTAVLLGILLMVAMPVRVWIEAVVWLVLGFAVYILYGYRHSEEARRGLPQERLVLLKTSITPVTESLY